jgi:hypothetical protein
MPKKLLLLGVTGASGRHVLAKAVEDSGVSVAVFARNPARIPAEQKSKAEIITGDLTDYPTLKAAIKSTKPDGIIITSCLGKGNAISPFNQLIVPHIVAALQEDGRSSQCKIVYLSGAFSPEVPDTGYGCMGSCMMSCFGIKGQVYDNTATQVYLHGTPSYINYTVVKMGMVAEKVSKGKLRGVRAVTGAMGASVTFSDVATYLVELGKGSLSDHARENVVFEYIR